MDILAIGTTPISDACPAGTDSRYEPAFEELQTEIDKIGSPSASEGVNWLRVSQLTEKILTEESKDLLVMSYFSVSQIHTRELEGLTTGLQAYCDLLETFWDTMFPLKKRMRGRVAAAEWWIENSASALELLRLQSVEEESKNTLLAHCDKLKQLFLELFPEPPSLNRLIRAIESLPIKKENAIFPPPEQVKEPEPKQQPPEQVEKKPTPAPEPKVQETASTSEDPIVAIQTANERIKRAALTLIEQDLPNPLGHRSLRTAIWSDIDALPQTVEGKTIIPPPEPHIILMIQDLSSRGDWINLSSTAERQFPQYIFWLDLQRYCATSLENLGLPYQKAWEAVCQETASFLHRLPGIHTLQFSDGTPFADEETKEWCHNLGSAGDGMDMGSSFVTADGNTAEANQLNNAIQQAGELLKERKLTEALVLLQQGIKEAHSSRESMQWRLALIRILISGKKAEMALPHCEKLVEELEHHKLEIWDPPQALIVYKTFYHCLKMISSKIVKERGRDLLDKIATLDSVEAIRISS